MSGSTKVCIVPEYPLNLMTGGLQVQAVETCSAVNQLGAGVTAELFDWSSTKEPADVYHFIGFPPYLSRIAELVEATGRPYAVTVLLGNPPIDLRLRMVALRNKIQGSGLGNILNKANAIIAITEADASALRLVYQVRNRALYVVPHGVSTVYSNASPVLWQHQFGKQPFVLCVGAIQPRKNQLLLVDACNRQKLPVVLLGAVLPGFQSYADDVRGAMKQNEQFGGRWITSLTNDDPLLPSAYAAARLVVLLSDAETQPLSVTQAMAAKKPILLMNARYVAQPLFNRLPLVDSKDPVTVAKTIESAWTKPQSTALPTRYTWPEVAGHLVEIYKKLL